LKALIIVLLVLTVLLVVPVGIDGGYNGKNLILGVKIGLFNIRILPKKKKALKLRKQKKPKNQKNQNKPANKKEKAKKQKKPLDKEQIIELAKAALSALGRFRKKLRVNYIRIHLTCASSDPFSTAMGFGASNAVMSKIVPLVDKAFIIDERDIGSSFDFLSDKPVFDFWITTTIQIWEILYIAIAFGIDLLKMKIKQKRKDRE